LVKELRPDAEVRILRHKMSDEDKALDCQFLYSIEDAVKFAPDFAIIANPATFHLDVALPLAEAGVSLLIEKPLSISMEGVNELLRVQKREGIEIVVGYNLRYSPSLQKFKALVDQHLIGDVLSVRAEAGQYLPYWRPGTDYRKGVSAKKSLGGGVLLELSHELDYLAWIFGDVYWVQACLGRQSNLDIDVEDTLHMIAEFGDSLNNQKLLATLSLDFFRRDATRCCTAIGEKGSLRWDGIGGVVYHLRCDPGAEWSVVYSESCDKDESYRRELADFMGWIEEKSENETVADNGIAALKIVDAIREASASGQRVFFDCNY
jgi:predicted dehydrogenase